MTKWYPYDKHGSGVGRKHPTKHGRPEWDGVIVAAIYCDSYEYAM